MTISYHVCKNYTISSKKLWVHKIIVIYIEIRYYKIYKR